MLVRATLLAVVAATFAADAHAQGLPAAPPVRQPAAAPFQLPQRAAARDETPVPVQPQGGAFRLQRPQPQRQAGAPATSGPPPIDESALRFYASRGEVARVASEIRRLRAAHPNWQPPADLLVEASERVVSQARSCRPSSAPSSCRPPRRGNGSR
jgi:cellulose synthase operon protein C